MGALPLAALTSPLRSSRRPLLLNLWFFFLTLKYLVIFPGTEDVLVEHKKKFLQVMPMRCFCPRRASYLKKRVTRLWPPSGRRTPEVKRLQICSLFRYAPRPWETSSALCSSVSSSVTKRCSSMNHVERESGSCKRMAASPSASRPVDPCSLPGS